jgi:hypothetical protein
LLKADAQGPQEEQSPFKALFNTMATCHSLRLVDDELIGDPLDLKMFEFTDWVFEEGEGGGAAQDARSPENGPSSDLSPSIVRPRGNPNSTVSLCISGDVSTSKNNRTTNQNWAS